MEFKCKYCNGTKYRQISTLVKQCEKCGRQINSEGVVDEKLDFTEDADITKEKLNAKFNPFNLYSTRITGSHPLYYMNQDLIDWFI